MGMEGGRKPGPLAPNRIRGSRTAASLSRSRSTPACVHVAVIPPQPCWVNSLRRAVSTHTCHHTSRPHGSTPALPQVVSVVSFASAMEPRPCECSVAVTVALPACPDTSAGQHCLRCSYNWGPRFSRGYRVLSRYACMHMVCVIRTQVPGAGNQVGVASPH